MTPAPVIVRMAHMRQAQYCAAGVRAFFARHGFDWGDFLQHGIASERLEATGDAMAIKVCEVARRGR